MQIFGAGQVDNIRIARKQDQVELVVVDGALTPIQQRNLEDKLARKVIDDVLTEALVNEERDG